MVNSGLCRVSGALVTEGAIEFEDLFQPAHNETLEIKFRAMRRYRSISSALWCVMKGFAAAPPAKGMHHGSFHFHEAVLFHEAAKFPG